MAGQGGARLSRRPPAVARVLERVTATARRHEMFLPGQTVLVAVSGGPDSICLLNALHMLRRLLRIRLEVFHFDHGLRPDSAADAGYVRRVSDRLGVPFTLVAASERPPRGASVEAWARGQRLRAAAYVRRDVDAARIAFGHTRDDQAETVLLAALTGSGLDGLKGIDPATGPYVRPLIDVSRDEVEAFCRALRLRPRLDPTNRSTRFLRNRVRLRAIPALERATGRSVREPLARVASLLREDARELNRQAFERWGDVFDETPDGVTLAVEGLEGLPRAIASRIVSLAIIRAGAGGGGAPPPPPRAPGPRRGAPRTPARVAGRFEGGSRQGVHFPLSLFPREPGSIKGARDGRPGRTVRTHRTVSRSHGGAVR